MAEKGDDDKESKTELPTEKKIRDALEKGNTPFSQEVTLFATSVAILVYLIFFAPSAAGRLAFSLKDIFEKSDEWQLNNGADALALFRQLFFEMGTVLIPAFVLLMLFGIAGSIFQTKPRLVLERIRPQMSRVSVFKGLKKLFGVQGLVQFLKSIFKIIIVSAVIIIAMRGDFFDSLAGMFSEPQTMPASFLRLSIKVLTIVVLCMAVLALADLLWTRHHWFNELRMTRQEMKDEIKQSEGDPILRSRQRSLARDRARRRMIAAVPRATMVIANPTHYAVALRYVREENEAPILIAKGQDLVALKIREIAEENGIPVFEDPPLARSMFAQVSVDSVIEPIFYKAVAELVHRVYKSKPQPQAPGSKA